MGSTPPTHTIAMHSCQMSTWGLRGTLATVVIAVVVARIGGAAIYAATGDGPHLMAMHGPPPHDHTAAPHDPAPASESAELHGEVIVPDGAGGFTTVLTQTGRVTAISPTSVTARSDDGFSQTYVIAARGSAAVNTPPFAVNDLVTTIDYARTGGGAAGPPPVLGHN